MAEPKSRFVWKEQKYGWQLHTTQPEKDIDLVRSVEGVAIVTDYIAGSGFMVVDFNPCYDVDEVKAEIEQLLTES